MTRCLEILTIIFLGPAEASGGGNAWMVASSGMVSTCPTWIVSGSLKSFTVTSASNETPYFTAISPNWSPGCTVYLLVWRGVGFGVAVGTVVGVGTAVVPIKSPGRTP